MFSKIKSAINKARERDKAAREKEGDGQSVKKTISQIKGFFAFAGAAAPLFGFAAIMLISVCAILLPILAFSSIINGVADAAKEFGASLGNLFTSGCYGTDDECLASEEAKQEIAFKESIEAARNAYRSNAGGKMNNTLIIGTKNEKKPVSDNISFGIDDVTAKVTIKGSNNSVDINVPRLVSSLLYFETTVSSYDKMQQENMICDKLISLGFLEEEGATCSETNTGDMNNITYEWYEFAISAEDQEKQTNSGGYLKSDDTLADQTGVHVYEILKAARPEGVTKYDRDGQCGNFNDLYLDGYGLIYSGQEEESLWDSFVAWLTGSDKVKVNRLQALSKFSVKRNVEAICDWRITDYCPDGIDKETGECTTNRKAYAPDITITVTFSDSPERLKKYLTEEYVPSSQLESYLFEQVELLREAYEKDNETTVEGTGDTKKFLEDATSKIQVLGSEYLSRREKDKEEMEKQYAEIADNIFELASIYEEEWGSYTLISAVCPGVTVTGEGAGTYSLDDYVAGVVAHEAYRDGGSEAHKAQAIAARSYLLKMTNNCTKSIENSQSAQTFNPNPPDWAKQAANDTSGLVLVSGGEVILAMYDSFCYGDSDCPDAVCDETECTVEYTKLPNNEKHKITLNGWRNAIVPGGGHAMGMSQLVSYEMAAAGSTYEDILKFFYSDSVEISTMASGAGLKEIDGFPARVSRATRDNPYFYGEYATNEGECAWYAVKRTNEILGSYGSTERVTTGGDGGDFCYSSDYQKFKNRVTSTDNIDEIQPGDVISWSSSESAGATHNYGHVAVVEVVHRDSSGKIKSINISEAGVSYGNGIQQKATYNGITLKSAKSIWDAPANIKPALRQFNCEYTNKRKKNATGCQNFREISRSKIINFGKGYKFECAIHIVK